MSLQTQHTQYCRSCGRRVKSEDNSLCSSCFSKDQPRWIIRKKPQSKNPYIRRSFGEFTFILKSSSGLAFNEMKYSFINCVLGAHNWNRNQSARALNVSERTIRVWIKEMKEQGMYVRPKKRPNSRKDREE